MNYPKNGWLGMGVQIAAVTFVAAFVIMGSASSETSADDQTGAMVQTIGDVSVGRDGVDSVVRLGGLTDPIYSVTNDDGRNAVIVELVGVAQATAAEFGDAGQRIAAYDGVIDQVTVSSFGEDSGSPLTRVEIEMASSGRAEVVSTSGGLDIRVIPEVADIASAAEDTASQWVEAEIAETTPWQQVDDGATDAAAIAAFDSEDSIPMAQVVESASETVSAYSPAFGAASRITGVTTQTTAGGVLVGLTADGAVDAMEAFTLENPARLVVDLPGLTLAGTARDASVQSAWVTGVRIGGHDDKVRIVVDGGSAADGFEGRQIMPGGTGLWISIGGGEELAQAMNDALAGSEQTWVAAAPVYEAPQAEAVTESFPIAETIPLAEIVEANVVETFAVDTTPIAATTTAEEPAERTFAEVVETIAPEIVPEPSGLAEVYGLHYERANGLDRTAILSDTTLSYTTSAVDATTLVVSIQGATIAKAASDRIFPEAGGPVSLIHAFQQPEVATPEVRVVFTRAPNQEPVVSRQGSMLFVDFEDRGVAAAAPPAFPSAGRTDAVASAAATAAPSFDELASAGIAVPAAPVSAAPLEVVTDLPGFEGGTAMASAAAALDAAPDSVWKAPTAAPGAPAAVEVPAAIEVLEEGGLIDGKEYRGRRVSLDFKDVAIADVLRLIAEVSDLNIIAGDEVAGNVTIRLVEVPWDQALDVILMTKGLGFVRVGNVLRIAPSDVLKAEEEVRLQERRNKEKLEDLEVKLLPVNYATVKDTEGLVRRLLSARGTVNLDERTNTLIIKDISSVIDEASALISAIDTQTPQVMIEAKIVEANLDFTRELGSVWGIQTNQFTNAFDADTPRQDLGSEDLTFIDNNSLAFANPITSLPTGLATVGALILDQDFRVDAQIQAAESTGDGKIVSSPRVVTLDNKEARIEQGVSIPFQTFEGGDAQLQFIDAVLSLIVTPHITADESIIMEIQVTRNAPDSTVATPTGSPAIAKNVAQTETLVKDGQTLVLGGIYTITKTKTQSRVPYLHRIPVIGNAFRNTNVVDSRKELLVFVTPRIVRIPEMASR